MISFSKSRAELEAAGYVALCRSQDVPGLTPLRVEVSQGAVLVCRHRLGFVVVEDRCPHRDLSMEGAQLLGSMIICPHHQYEFDLQSGACQNRSRCGPLQVFESEAADGWVWARPRSEVASV